MMRVVIATGIFPPEPGGPAYYAEGLAKSLEKITYVHVLPFGYMKKLPSGIRHIAYLFRVCKALFAADVVIALDTFTVGVPAVLAAKLLGKKVVIRTGGDFLWEHYIERTKESILLSEFYSKERKLSVKERIIYWLTGVILRAADCVIFSTDWQRKIFLFPYRLSLAHTMVVENVYPKKESSEEPQKKNFLWAGRPIFLKNKEILLEAFREAQKQQPDISLEVLDGVPRQILFDRMRSCYAVLLPSLSEISPNLLLEAVAFDRPFMSTKDMGFVGGILKCGILIDPRDRGEITKAILSLADNEIYSQYRKNVKNFSYQRSYDDLAQDFMNIFRTL